MSVVTPTLLSDGQQMSPAFGLLSIDVRREVNRLPQAELALVDGDAAERESNEGFFEPGKTIEIKLRYEEKQDKQDETVFQGVVVRHGIEASADDSVLRIGLRDAAVKLTATRQTAVFRDKSDHEIAGDLLKLAGLEPGTLEATRPRHREIVRYQSTAWDFILSRAEANGLLVVVEDGKVSLRKPEAASDARQHVFRIGIDDVFDFEMEADAGHQYGAVESVAWSLKEQEVTQASRAAVLPRSQGNLDGGKIAAALGFDTLTLAHPVPVDPAELQAWADGRMARGRLSLLRGRIAVPGFAPVRLLDKMDLDGIGERWNGSTLVTGIRHRVDQDGWQTDLQFGLSPERFCRRPEVADCPAAGLLPPASGLRIGVVAPFEEDPEKELRVRVRLPGAGPGAADAVWARLASPEAGEGRGYFFRPESGDEVIVGFLSDDPRHPVVLGALYGSKNAPPADFAQPTAENLAKGIVTRMGTQLRFLDDEKAAVFIETAGKKKVVLDDASDTIQVSDKHNNSLTLDGDGIVIRSAKDVRIEASGNVEIQGAKVDVK